MTLIVAIDNNNGFRFNKRRQSRDSVLIERIQSLIGDEPLYISEYSDELFSCHKHVVSSLEDIPNESYLFVEDEAMLPKASQVDRLYLYKWNRDYPSDEKFNFDMSQFELIYTNEFAGTSHDCITEEIYARKGKVVK